MGQLTDEAILNLDWQWGANFPSCFNAVVSATNGDYANALATLNTGQAHNQHVQDVYQAVNDSIGTGPLWDLVATASLRGADLNKAQNLLETEFKENPETLSRARQAWHNGQWWLASALVQQGILVNPNYQGEVWSNYRACIRDQRNAFFAIIDSILT